jgi:Uma2 family endonuclease
MTRTTQPSETTPALMMAEELIRLPSGRQFYELVRGELRVREPAGGRHGQIIMTLGGLLFQHVRANRLGVLFSADTGFVLERAPDTVRAPDISFIAAARIDARNVTPKYLEGAPDLAVEVLSPGDGMLEMEDKMEEYFATGARLVWIVNPKRRRVTAYAPGAAPRVLREDDVLDGGDVVPGFACAVREIFDWPV